MRRDLVSPPCIGREAELTTLTSALDTAIPGTPTVLPRQRMNRAKRLIAVLPPVGQTATKDRH